MSRKLKFGELFKEAERGTRYWVERAVLEFTEDVVGRLKAKGISRTELARRIDASPAYVTKILRGNTNFTLESMVRIAQALGCSLRTHLQPDGARTHWFDMLEMPPVQTGVFENCADMNRELGLYSKRAHQSGMENKYDTLPLAS